MTGVQYPRVGEQYVMNLMDQDTKPNTTETSQESPAASGTLSPSEVRRALSAILQSPPFRSSPQIQKLLKFLVLETLEGHGEALKERVIGANVFERRPDYDTNADPIVRLRVGEVRKRLALYYQGARDENVLISIPSGSFKAVFEQSRHQAEPVRDPEQIQTSTSVVIQREPTAPVEPNAKSPSARFRLRKLWIMVAASLTIVPLVALWYLPSSEERAFGKFWAPVLDSSKTVLIGLGNNPLYELSNAGEDEYYKNHPKDKFEEMGLHPYIPLAPDTPIDGKFINPATNVYLTIGDAAALADVEYVLAQRHLKMDMRFVNDVTYGDLRQNPTVLIGIHNNIWTLNMMENLRYRFQGHNDIVDRSNPQNHWTANFDRSETYGVVARLLNSWNGKVVVIIGGVGYSGTRAAGDFITNPEAILKMSQMLPKGWEKKNVEVVLHTSVKNQVPGPADIVAAYAW